MDHLALKVSDQECTRRFYEHHRGFGAKPARRYEDGTLMIYNDRGFALALGVGDFEPHFGMALGDAESVRTTASRLAEEGVEIVEQWDGPEYVSVKVGDPDGRIVEFSWEPRT